MGRVIEFEYDAHDNLIEERWYVGVNLVHSILFDYDAAGQLLEAYDTASSYGYTYDGLGRVTSLSQSFAGFSPLLEYESTYDANSNRTLLQAIIGGTADFENESTYDDLDRLTRLQQSDYASGNAVAEKRFDFFYSANSQLSRFDRYADLAGTEYVASTHYAYDAIGRLLRLTHNDSTSSTSGFGTNPLAGYQFTYDAASRITDIDSYLDGLSEYTYDATNQLVDADHAGQSDEAYEFDENGNRVMSGYSIDPNNQLASDGAYNYTYDAEGNRLTKTNISTGAKEELTWDHRNRLTKVTFKNSGGTVLKTVDYVYDAFDRMIRRTYDADGPGGAAATDRFFSWENDQINLEFDGTTASDLAHRHTWAEQIDHLLATEDISSLVTPGDVIWALNDHLGTARDLVEYDTGTNTPTVENHREYNSFGILVSQTNGAFSITFGFTGVFHDVVTLLNYHRARWYDPATGNWTAEDPIGFAGEDTNLRRYVGNAALSATDPSGLHYEVDENGNRKHRPPVSPRVPPWKGPRPEKRIPWLILCGGGDHTGGRVGIIIWQDNPKYKEYKEWEERYYSQEERDAREAATIQALAEADQRRQQEIENLLRRLGRQEKHRQVCEDLMGELNELMKKRSTAGIPPRSVITSSFPGYELPPPNRLPNQTPPTRGQSRPQPRPQPQPRR